MAEKYDGATSQRDVESTESTDTDSSRNTETSGTKSLHRRSLLKLAGAAGAATAGFGISGTAAAETTAHGITFDRVVDAVDDLGMDPTGGQPIDAAFDAAIETGTLVEFPPGEYLLKQDHSEAGVSRFGVRGLGSHRNDVRFLPEAGATVAFLHGGGPGPFMIENVSFDERSDDVSMLYLGLGSQNGCYVGNVEWLGRTPLDDGSDYTINADVYDQDAVSVFENVYAGLDEPAVEATYPDGVAFLRAGPSHAGEVIIRNPVIHERNSAATRLEAGPGVTTIEGGEFVNNQNANIRFGAGDHPSKVSSATGTYVKVDGSRDSADAVRLGGAASGYAGAVFRDLEIEWTKDRGRGVIALPDFGDHGRAEFYNCVVRNDSGHTTTLNADAVDIDDDALIVENCSFTGSGKGFDAADRDGSVIRDSCIDMPNANIAGFTTENVSTEGCPVPGGEGDSNAGPTADITVTGSDALSVDLSGSESTDSDGEILAYTWSVEGSTHSGETVTHTFAEAGTYAVGLTVEDDNGATASTSTEVSVTYDNKLVIQGTGSVAEYDFEVSGDLEPFGDTVESWDEVTESGAQGYVTETTDFDEFVFSGSITSFEFLQNEADVYLNGEQFDPTSSRLTIRGTGTASKYHFEVDGTLEPVAETIEKWDDVEDDSASGWVTAETDVDEYVFSGDLASFRMKKGDADVSVDGSEIEMTFF